MTPHTDNVVERPADLTAAWLTAAIGAGDITDFTVERIGTGQMSECYRVQLSYADTAPLADNATDDGRARNRRVDDVILNETGLRGEPPHMAKQEGPKKPSGPSR